MYVVDVEWMGRVDYGAAWEQQKALVAERTVDPELAGKLLLLEHPPTYTLGRNGRLENLLLDKTDLAEKEISFYHIDRGGDITYHGPGQLVGYPILNLKQLYPNYGLGRVRRYITALEEVLIQALAALGIRGCRFENHRGVWVSTVQGMHKIAAVGVHINTRGISSHGFALNVAPDLSYFAGIIPCGIQEHGVTSIAALQKRPLTIATVLPPIITAFREVFQVETNQVTVPDPFVTGT